MKNLLVFIQQRKFPRFILLFVVLFLVYFLVTFVPKVFFSLSTSGQKYFIMGFTLALPATFLAFKSFFPSKISTDNKSAIATHPIESEDLESLQKDLSEYQNKLSKYQSWTYVCLGIAWIVVFLCSLMKHPFYSNPAFYGFVFLAALLLGTKNLEKELELDYKLANCILKGAQLESSTNQSKTFTELLKSYQGYGLWHVIFVRISPTLMILFSGLNIGVSKVLYKFFNPFFVNIALGAFFGVSILFLGKLIGSGYKQLARLKL